MAIDRLLEHLEQVRRTGVDRWLARCPAHDDNSPSLSIREVPDGRVLLHCWAGCETQSVLDALGLTFSDLFPEPLSAHMPRLRRAFNAHDALVGLEFEAMVVAIAAADMEAGKPIDRARLQLAAQRIGAAVEAARGG